METDISYSRSLSASFDISGLDEIILRNHYLADRKAGGPPEFRAHEGTNKLTITMHEGRVSCIIGQWYTEQSIGGHGDIFSALS